MMKKYLITFSLALVGLSAFAQSVDIRPAGGGTTYRFSTDNMVSAFEPSFSIAPLKLNDVCFDRRRGSQYIWNGVSWSSRELNNGEAADQPWTKTNQDTLNGWDASLYNRALLNKTAASSDTVYIARPSNYLSQTPHEKFVIEVNNIRTSDADTMIIQFDSLFRTFDGKLLRNRYWKCPPRGRIVMTFKNVVSVEGAQWYNVDDILGSYQHGSGSTTNIKVSTAPQYKGVVKLAADSVGYTINGLTGFATIKPLDKFPFFNQMANENQNTSWQNIIDNMRDSIFKARNGVYIDAAKKIVLGNTYMLNSPSSFLNSRKLNTAAFKFYIGNNADSLRFIVDPTNKKIGLGMEPATAAGNHILQILAHQNYALGIRDATNAYWEYEWEDSGGGPLMRLRNNSTSQSTIGWNAGLSGWAIRFNTSPFYFNEALGGASANPVWNVKSTYTVAPGSPATVDRYYWAFNSSPTFSTNAGGRFAEVAFNPTIVNNSTNGQTTVQAYFSAALSGTAASANTAIKIDNVLGKGIDQTSTVLTNSFMGNTGIGTATPTQKLDVNGDARLRGAIYDNGNNPGTLGQVPVTTGTGWNWGTASGCTISVSQTAHGFTAGQSVYWNGTIYVAVAGNFSSVTTPSGVVASVTSANVFVLATCGPQSTNFGLADGLYYASNSGTGLSTTTSIPQMPMLKVEGSKSLIWPMLAFRDEPDTIYVKLVGAGKGVAISATGELTNDFFVIDPTLAGYTLDEVTYAVTTAGTTSGSMQMRLARYTSANVFALDFAAASFAVGDTRKTATAGTTAVSGDYYILKVQSESFAGDAQGMSATIRLIR